MKKNWKEIYLVFIGILLFTGVSQAQSFTDNGDGTVTDSITKLTWQKCSRGQNNNATWESALTYCEGLSLASYGDWHLPNRNELQSLVDYSKSAPAIDTTYFPATDSSVYWSSTSNASDTGHAWDVYFGDGDVSHYFGKSNSYNVRCVR